MTQTLQKVTDQIWTVAVPHTMMGLRLGSRMTVVRLSDGGVLLHSPVPLSASLRQEISSIGSVAHIVCPNLFHHSYAAEAQAAYPQALLHGPKSLSKKRPNLRLQAELSDTAHPSWKGELLPLSIKGCDLQETVLFHPGSKTLISADLTENFTSCDHWPTRLYLQAGGIYGRIGWSRLLRFLYKDRAAARQSIQKLLAWDFERLIISHGDLILQNPKESIQQTFVWL